MARFHAVAIAAGLLLAVSGPSFAAKRANQVSDANGIVKRQPRPIKSQNSTIHQYQFRDDPYSYGREADPYAPGVNWPKGA